MKKNLILGFGFPVGDVTSSVVFSHFGLGYLALGPNCEMEFFDSSCFFRN